MQEKNSIFTNDNEETRFQSAKALAQHLYKIGQIKEEPTDKRMKEIWEKLEREDPVK